MFKYSPLPQFIFSTLLLAFSICFNAIALTKSKTNLSHKIYFSNINAAKHLPHETVNSIEQDNQGFIWFATQNGISRFDGKQSTLFTHQLGDKNSLSNNWVWDLHSDSEGRLWAASSGGFHLYTPEKNGFINFSSLLKSNNVNGESYVAIAEDHNNNVWFASQFSGLTQFNTSTAEFSTLDSKSSIPLNSDNLFDVVFDEEGNMWVATASNGINFRAKGNDAFDYLTKNSDFPIPSNKIRKLELDHNQNVWVATEDAGVFVLDKNKIIKHYQFKNNENSICADSVYDILQAADGTMWFATINGLCQLNLSNDEFTHYHHQASNPSSLVNNRVLTLKQDSGGVIWAGTYSGVSRWNASLAYFSHINKTTSPNSLTDNSVMTFASNNNLFYVGTWAGGLNKFSINGNKLISYSVEEPLKALNEESVVSLLAENDNSLWIGTFRNGLYHYNQNNSKLTSYLNSKNSNSISHNSVSKLLALSNGKIAIATYGGGLNLFDPIKHTFQKINHIIDNNLKERGLYIIDIVEDENQNIWIASSDEGLLKYNIKSNTLSQPLNKYKSLKESFGSVIFSVLLSEKKYIWLSGSNGITKIDKTTLGNDELTFQHIGTKQGLASNFVYGLLEDDKGYIWFSHGKGLSRLHPKTYNVVNFDRTHGLQGNDFNSSAFYKNRDGRMFFGGPNGFNTFMPDNVPINQYKPSLQLTQFSLSNKVVPIQTVFKPDGYLQFEYNNTIIDFTFAALDFTQPENNNYKFKMHGLNDVWHELGNNNHVSFSYLEDGKYKLVIKGSNNDNVWSDELIIPIRVLPPVWRSASAYSIYFLCFFLIVFVLLRQHKKKKLKQQANQKHLHKLAYFDSLTDLPNRQSFYEELNTFISYERPYSNDIIAKKASVLVIDLDRFKRINDTLGHEFGDKVLIAVTKCLTKCIKNIIESENNSQQHIYITGEMARLGGDEFAVLFKKIKNHDQIKRIAKAIINELSTPIKVDNYEVTVTPSIGITLFPENGNSASDLLKHADIAMYQAKENGGRMFEFYKEEHNNRSIERLRLEEYLHSAIKNDELELHYQPQINLKENKVTKAEALIRWNSPVLGFVSPADLIAVAEESGLIIEIGDWILNTACQQAKLWQENGVIDCKISINVSSIQFKQSALIKKIKSALKTSGLPANLLEIELTESAIMSDVEDNIQRLQDIKDMGISIACDDFGTGYSSLSYLKQFPLDTLKIDRSFIDDIANDENDEAIVKMIMLLAETIQLDVVAEGVETLEQLRIMNRYNCKLIQGYYFSKPLPNEDFIKFAKDDFYKDKFMWELELVGQASNN